MLIKTLILGSTLLCLASADSHRNGLKMIVGIKQPQYGVQIFRGAGARQKAIDAGIINPFNSHFSGNRRGKSGGHTGGLGGNNGSAGGVNGDGSGASGNHNGANGNGGTVHNNYTPIPPKTTTHPPTTTPAPTTTTTTTTTPAPTTTYATAPPPTRPPYSPPKPPVHPTTYPVPPYPRPTPPLYRPPTHPPRKYGSPPSGYSHPQYKPVDANYDWEYAVKDNHYNDFGHKESRHGYAATGLYYVSLPDGRIQKVTYVADENGYKPVVEFQGQAAYPEDKN